MYPLGMLRVDQGYSKYSGNYCNPGRPAASLVHISIKWSWSVGENCSNPKYLQKNIGAGVLDLDIWGIKISTFDDYFANGYLQLNYHEIVQNDTFFEWTDSYLNYHRGGCHTLEFKETVTKHGIKYVNKIDHTENR